MKRRTISEHPTPRPAPTGHDGWRRVLALKIALLIFFAVVALRLVQIQVIDAAEYQAIARTQYHAEVPLLASRGSIYDRNGNILVSNTITVSFGADPTMVGEKAGILAERFAHVFKKPKSEYLEKLRPKSIVSKDGTRRPRRFEWLERRVRADVASLISVSDIEGVVKINEPMRIYRYDTIAGQVLGYTDIDNNGLSGIELAFNEQLRGRSGYVIMQRDGLGRRRPTVDYPRVEPINGNDLVLTLDLAIQSVAEEELRNGIERTKAESGLVVILDPATGEVLAMASYPGINPNQYSRMAPGLARNRIIADVFEPGSVFKVVTAAAAIDKQIISPAQTFYAEKGRYVIKGRPNAITDVHEYGTLTFRDAIELSSNIVMAKAADRVGAENLYTTARDFGFGIRTGIELPGEVSGQLKKPKEWSRTTLHTIAYGYEVGVTPLQIAAAYAAVANGGTLMRPFIVKQIVKDQTEVIAETTPQPIRRVITKATADTLRAFFRGVVERGTATTAKSTMVEIAGKTGTSRKLINGKYSTSEHTASFVGMFPANDPQMVCLVMLDKPNATGYYGGIATAPIVKRIAEQVSNKLPARQAPVAEPLSGKDVVTMPDVRTLDVEAASSILSSMGLTVRTDGEGNLVLSQSPAPGVRLMRKSNVTLSTTAFARSSVAGNTVVPDLRGLTVRRALNRLTMARLDARVDGSGIVVSQSPAPGEQVRGGTRVLVRCEPKHFSTVAGL